MGKTAPVGVSLLHARINVKHFHRAFELKPYLHISGSPSPRMTHERHALCPLQQRAFLAKSVSKSRALRRNAIRDCVGMVSGVVTKPRPSALALVRHCHAGALAGGEVLP